VVASFELKFAGIDTPKDGFLELALSEETPENITKKRKYNLFTNNSAEGPSKEDRINHFRKLTENSACWYQKVRPRDDDKKGNNLKIENNNNNNNKKRSLDVAKSCKKCGEPMVEKVSLSGEKFETCSQYPHCDPGQINYLVFVNF